MSRQRPSVGDRDRQDRGFKGARAEDIVRSTGANGSSRRPNRRRCLDGLLGVVFSTGRRVQGSTKRERRKGERECRHGWLNGLCWGHGSPVCRCLLFTFQFDGRYRFPLEFPLTLLKRPRRRQPGCLSSLALKHRCCSLEIPQLPQSETRRVPMA